MYHVSQMELTELEKSIRLVMTLTGKSEDEIDRMSVAKFNRLCSKVDRSFKKMQAISDMRNPVSFVWVKGRLYHISYDIREAGTYVEAATFSGDFIGNLHKIMASAATPLNWRMKPYKRDHAKIAEDMLSMDFDVAYHAGVFFSALFIELMKTSLSYSQLSEKEMAEARMILVHLQGTSDGFITANWYRKWRVSNLMKYGN